MAFHPNAQLRLLEQGFDPTAMLRQSLTKGTPWSSIIEFATSEEYCGLTLYPRQQTLLKLIFLEVENMTAYDLEVIEEWRKGFVRPRNVYGVQPDIWERVEYLKRRGYRRFPHIQLVLGRRASKGFIGAIVGAEQIAYLVSLDNPQYHYGIREGKDVFLNVGATSQTQAQRHQFADIRDVVENCAWLQRYIAETKDHQMRLRTPADFRRIAAMQAQGVPIEHTIATLWCVALSASSVAGRGATSYCLDPETPVLTADLQWVPIKSVMPGDAVVGLDEFPGRAEGSTRNGQRKLRRAQVLAKATTVKEAYRITLDNGKSVTCSADHRWLLRRSSGPLDWRVTRGQTEFHSLKVGDKIVQVVEPWEQDRSWEAGYLAGVFDGEGSMSRGGERGRGAGGLSVFFSQNPGPTLDRVLGLLKDKGFSPQPANSSAYSHDGKCEQWAIRGVAESLRFLGQIRPGRLTARAALAYDGLSLRGKGSTRYVQPSSSATIVAIEPLGKQTLVDIQTTTSTFVANGLVSHNCNMFDEFAFHVQGSGSTKSGEEIYEDWQPSLGQFKKEALTFIPSSPFTKVGKFYELYQHGKMLMSSYKDESGLSEDAVKELRNLRSRADLDEVELGADPGMLIFQGPSWAQPVDTPILTPQGWRPMGELVEGDFVIGADGHPTKVTAVVRRGTEPVYRVTMNDGSSTRTSAGHLWAIQDWNERAENTRPPNTVASTEQIARLVAGQDARHPRTFIPMVDSAPAFDTPEDDLAVPGYLLGFLLGDGCLRVGNSPRVALAEPEQNVLIEQELAVSFPQMRLVFHSGVDWGIVSGYQTPDACSLCDHPPLARGLCSGHYHQAKYQKKFKGQPKNWGNPLGQALRELGVMGLLGPDKFVPERYLVASPSQRLAVLQGLMDADGTYAKGKHSAIFFNTSRQLCEAVVELAESLGGQGRMWSRPPRKPGRRQSWHVSIRLPSELVPFRLSRKAQAYRDGIKTFKRAVPVRKIVAVEPEGQALMQCIEVAAPDGLYVTEHYIVTHNCLYEDWERGAQLISVRFTTAPEDDLSSEEQMRRKLRNPEKFAVEREGQFAEVMGQYLDSVKVDAMFRPVSWRTPAKLEPTAFGRFDYTYRIHADPSTVGANFALAIGHTELAPCDRCGELARSSEQSACVQPGCSGEHWPHVIIDRLHVWRPRDFPINVETGKHEINYTQVERELDQILYSFPSTTKFSTDQFHSTGILQRLRNKYSPGIRVVEETATESTNWERAEKFKSALNLGWVHSYADNFYDDGECLLELECKFLSEKNGKVYKQEFGPVQTKDLYDAVSVVVTDLLHEALERWSGERMTAHAFGSSNVAGLKSGRELERAGAMGANTYVGGHHGRGKAWDALYDSQLDRRRRREAPSPNSTRRISRERRY